MKKFHRHIFLLFLLLWQTWLPAWSANTVANNNAGNHNAGNAREVSANKLAFPKQILRTGVSLNSTGIAPNTLQLASTIGLTAYLQALHTGKNKLAEKDNLPALDTIALRQDCWDAIQKGSLIIQKTNLEIDFVLAEINAELQVYNEILATFTNDRDKLLARVNAASFISNGALWAVCEGLTIPTYNRSRYAISSGIVGILAGMVPSVASMYTLKAVNGKKKTSEEEPNMLAKLFDYPTNPDIEYPGSVWQYLHQVPADQAEGKKRLDQLVDRWIADSNISAFTNRESKKQIDVITASVARRDGLTIGTLTARQVMLNQLAAEILKMKRMLLELSMVLNGEKEFVG